MAGGFVASSYGCGPVGADIQDDSNHLHAPHIPSVSARHCKPFSAGFCDRGPKPSQKGCLSSVGAWHPCLLPAIFEECHGQKNEGKETVIRPDIETRQTITGAFQLKFEGMGD
ncbi:hypothetical protein [Flavonifractor hominis]|uniref:Uncharacterized protein n=1 Tax=Flavonifractor hominis TaxID=3133178 RepID=A0ABV1ERJ8_9FIRM